MSGGSRFDTAATVLLLVLGIVVAQQAIHGTLGSWLRSKFLGGGVGSSPGGLFALFGPMPDTSPADASGADSTGTDAADSSGKPKDSSGSDPNAPKDTSPGDTPAPGVPPPDVAPAPPDFLVPMSFRPVTLPRGAVA